MEFLDFPFFTIEKIRSTMPTSPVSGATKREIGKPSGETPDAQRARSSGQMQMPEVPLMPTASARVESLEGKFDTMMELMKSMKTEMTDMKNAIVTEVKNDVKQICRDELKEMDKRICDLEQSRISGRPMSTNTGPTLGPLKEEILEVVVKGFKEKRAKDAIVSDIDEMLKTILGESHGVTINVPQDPANHGVLTFANNEDKLKLYKRVEEQKDKLDGDISFANKLSWPDRVIEKKLGYIKHHLMSFFNKPVSDIKINWRRRFVEMGGKKVASYDAGTWVFHKSARVIEIKVNEAMEKWTSERETTDPPSESE